MGRKRRAVTLLGNRTREECWTATIARLPNNFFKSDEARMTISGRFKPGEVGYASIPFNENNNNDIHLFWDKYIRVEELNGNKVSQWEAWLRTWGQFARLCVVRNVQQTFIVEKNLA